MVGDEPEAHRLLELAFLADAANNQGGNLNALGIGTNLVRVQYLPVVHHITLVVRIAWVGGQIAPGQKTLDARVVDPNDQEIAAVHVVFGVDPNQQNPHPELAVGANMVLPLPMELTTMGVHHVEITVEGDPYPPLPFKVIAAGA